MLDIHSLSAGLGRYRREMETPDKPKPRKRRKSRKLPKPRKGQRVHLKSDSYNEKYPDTGERLAHLVFLSVWTNNNEWFSALMTRVPCLGEKLANQGVVYLVTSVLHSLVTPSGKSPSGCAAHLDVVAVPDE